MINQIDPKLLEGFILGNFAPLTFTPSSIWLDCEKISRHGLMRLCALLWNSLVSNVSVINGTYKVAPACSWNALSYGELNCLCRVLLKDFCQVYIISSVKIDKAYRAVLNKTPFTTFIDSKTDKDITIKLVVGYSFNGIIYPSVDAVKNAVYEVYPSTKYNVNLIF